MYNISPAVAICVSMDFMRKFILSVLLLTAFCVPVLAQSFDFSQKGDEEANVILKEYVKTEIEGFHGGVTGYFYDMDNDGRKEIIGIVQSKLYCTIAGYNLVVLKEDENGWGAIQTDIYFDNGFPFEISGNKVSYNKTIFYKYKKAYATVKKNNSYKAAASIKDHYTNKKIKGIEEATAIGEGHPSIEVDEKDFPASEQGTFVISYPEGFEKPKYHIELH